MITNSASIVYNPLDIAFDVIEKGGSSIQKKETSTGRYDPNRAITPLVLIPNLQVKDPEKIILDGDYSQSLTNPRWYIDKECEANRVTKTTEGFTIGDYGRLTVTKNSEPDKAETLIFVVQFIDPRRNELMEFRKLIALACDAVNEINLSLEFDAPVRLPIVPFKNIINRTINAQLKNGANEVPDSDAVYVWKVLDGNSFRAITADDYFYVAGQNTKSIVIDRRYIDKEVVRVEAYHKSLPTSVESAQTKLHRWYGQYEERCDIVRGKMIHPDTKETEVLISVINRQGNIVNPERFFDIGIFFRRDIKGENWRSIAHSPSIVVPSSMAGVKYGVRAVFGAEIRELSALRALTINGKEILINGKTASMQIPNKSSEL